MKKTITLFLSFLFLLSMLSGCNNPSSFDNTTESSIDTADETSQPNPTSDFEYQIHDSNQVTITKFIGESSEVIIPPTIDGKPVTTLGNMCFMNNMVIRSVSLPNTVIKIEGGAFFRCTKLENLNLPSSLKEIGNGAFEGSAISEVVFPATLTKIGMRAFADCANLKHITLSKEMTFGEEIFAGSGLETLVIEEGVETIAASMFAFTNIQKIVLPQSVKVVGMNAFGGCANLNSIILNEGLEKVNTYAFAKTAITEIVIPKSVTTITDAVFQSCPKIQKVKFEGNAPNEYISGIKDMPIYTICYHETAKGFTTPEWNGYLTQLW